MTKRRKDKKIEKVRTRITHLWLMKQYLSLILNSNLIILKLNNSMIP